MVLLFIWREAQNVSNKKDDGLTPSTFYFSDFLTFDNLYDQNPRDYFGNERLIKHFGNRKLGIDWTDQKKLLLCKSDCLPCVCTVCNVVTSGCGAVSNKMKAVVEKLFCVFLSS